MRSRWRCSAMAQPRKSTFTPRMNFAGVWKTPTVFFCQNNRYAQSTPIEQQTASETLAQKAHRVRYRGSARRRHGRHRRQHRARCRDRQSARAAGQRMIESLCYRYTPHSTYDGTPVYRTREEEAEWKEKDPLVHARTPTCSSRGLIDADFESAGTSKTMQGRRSRRRSTNSRRCRCHRETSRFAPCHHRDAATAHRAAARGPARGR